MSNEPTLDNGIDITTELNTNSNKYTQTCALCARSLVFSWASAISK